MGEAREVEELPGLKLWRFTDSVLFSLPWFTEVEVFLQYVCVVVVIHVVLLIKVVVTQQPVSHVALFVSTSVPFVQLVSMLWRMHALHRWISTRCRMGTVLLVFLAMCLLTGLLLGDESLELLMSPAGLFDIDVVGPFAEFRACLGPLVSSTEGMFNSLCWAPKWSPMFLGFFMAVLLAPVWSVCAQQADLCFRVRLRHAGTAHLVDLVAPRNAVALASILLPVVLFTLWMPCVIGEPLKALWTSNSLMFICSRYVVLVLFCACRFLSIPMVLQYFLLRPFEQPVGSTPQDAQKAKSYSIMVDLPNRFFRFVVFPSVVLLLTTCAAAATANAAVIASGSSCSLGLTNHDMSNQSAGTTSLDLMLFSNMSLVEIVNKELPDASSAQLIRSYAAHLRSVAGELTGLIPHKLVTHSICSFLVVLLVACALVELCATASGRAEEIPSVK